MWHVALGSATHVFLVMFFVACGCTPTNAQHFSAAKLADSWAVFFCSASHSNLLFYVLFSYSGSTCSLCIAFLSLLFGLTFFLPIPVVTCCSLVPNLSTESTSPFKFSECLFQLCILYLFVFFFTVMQAYGNHNSALTSSIISGVVIDPSLSSNFDSWTL